MLGYPAHMTTGVLAPDRICFIDVGVRLAIKRSLACTERSRALLSRSVHGVARLLHPICGGTDDPVPLVIDVLATGAAMCRDCIAKQTGIPLAEMPSVIARTRETLRLHMPRVPCTVCGTPRSVYRRYDRRAGDLGLVNSRSDERCVSRDCGDLRDARS